MKKIKTDLTIQELGKSNFLLGIIIWLGTGLFLHLMFQYFVKISYLLSPLFSGVENAKSIQNLSFKTHLFLALTASSLAFSFAAYIWLSNVFHKNFRLRRLIRISKYSSLFIMGLMAFMLFRFFTVLMTFNLTHLDFDLINHFGIFSFSLPLFIFLYNWMYISKAYRALIPLIITFIFWISYSLLLTLLRT